MGTPFFPLRLRRLLACVPRAGLSSAASLPFVLIASLGTAGGAKRGSFARMGGVCVRCGADFHTRVRVIRHLTGRGACAAACARGELDPVPLEEVARLDAIDVELRFEARRSGADPFCGPPVKLRAAAMEAAA